MHLESSAAEIASDPRPRRHGCGDGISTVHSAKAPSAAPAGTKSDEPWKSLQRSRPDDAVRDDAHAPRGRLDAHLDEALVEGRHVEVEGRRQPLHRERPRVAACRSTTTAAASAASCSPRSWTAPGRCAGRSPTAFVAGDAGHASAVPKLRYAPPPPLTKCCDRLRATVAGVLLGVVLEVVRVAGHDDGDAVPLQEVVEPRERLVAVPPGRHRRRRRDGRARP